MRICECVLVTSVGVTDNDLRPHGLPSDINPDTKHATPPSKRTKESVPFLPSLRNYHVR